jgi:hypothetical protein
MGEETGPMAGKISIDLDSGEGLCEGWVMGRGDYHVVRDTGRRSRLEHSVVHGSAGLDLVEGNSLVTEGIHIKVNAAIVVEYKVSNSIGALNVKGECVPSVKEPRVLFRDKDTSSIVGPVLR